MEGVNYRQSGVPKEYRCAECGKTGLKLWREYQTSHPQLLCAECAATIEGKDISSLGDDGKISGQYGIRTYSIGWFVPAIPDEEGVGYWGSGAIPPDGLAWWLRLPNRK